MTATLDDDDYDFDDLAEFDDDYEAGTPMTAEADHDDFDDLSDLLDPDVWEGVDPEPAFERVDPEPALGTRKGKALAPPEPVVLGRERTNSRGVALISTPATATSEAIRRPLISGHCSSPQTNNPDESHLRCQKNGGGSRANPGKIFQPCPCLCHFPPERYECASCGGTIVAAPHYPPDEDGDTHYVHLDTKRMRVTDGECAR